MIDQYTIQDGDEIHRVALKTLGNADQWWVLVVFNQLDHPYIDTSGAIYSGKKVLTTGDSLLIPKGVDAPDVLRALGERSPELYRLLLGVDLALNDDGDLSGVSGPGGWQTEVGLRNLVQALVHRLQTRKGELVFHPDYGSHLERHVGQPHDVARQIALIQEVRETLLADPRITRVLQLDVDAQFDHIDVNAVVQIIGQNESVPLNLVLNRTI